MQSAGVQSKHTFSVTMGDDVIKIDEAKTQREWAFLIGHDRPLVVASEFPRLVCLG